MKTLHLSIILIVGIMIILSIQNAISMPDLSPQDLYKQSDMVFYGQVISKQAGPGPDYYYYQIKVQTYFKNPQTTDSITAAGHKPEEGHMTYPQFEIGDKAIFYISKIDGINTISPWSQIAGDACDAHSFLGPEYFGTLGNYHGGPASNTRLLDVNGNALEKILTNQEIVLRYDDVWNNYPESRTIPVSVSIQNEDNGQQIFNKTQDLQVQACSFAGDLKWNFVPTQIGNYVAKIDVDNKTKMTYGFSVMSDSTSNLQIIPSPLKQIKSGIVASDVKCKQDFLLIIKSEDNHPACTSPRAALRLLDLGWGQIESPFETKTDLLVSRISGGQIIGFHYDLQAKSILVNIQTTSDGSLTITIPRKLLDVKVNGHDDHFYILLDGREIDFTETGKTDVARTITIPFSQDIKQIEVIGSPVG